LRRRRWWAEVLLIVVAYELYARVRIHVEGATASAMEHARQVIGAERFVGGFFEARLQRAVGGAHGLLRVANVFYGSVHFIVPVVALVWLWRRAPERYAPWRNAFGIMLALAVVGFALYPLAPPRLLPAHYGFVDTAATFGGLGSIGGPDSGPNNLYAAMPSLHIGWSLWCALALWPIVRGRLGKALLAAYPAVSQFVVIVTANHYWLDGVGGAVVLAGGLAASTGLHAWSTRRKAGTGRSGGLLLST
jgi:hypothetical protein